MKSINIIIGKLYQAAEGLTIQELLENPARPESARAELTKAVHSLLKQGLIYKSSKKKYSLSKKHQLAEAVIEKNPRGFGFGTRLIFKSDKKQLQRDPYISLARMNTALHGDIVLLRILKVRRDGRPEAEVVRVLQRTTRSLAGIYHYQNGQHLFSPDDIRFPFTVIVKSPDEKISDGDAVIIKLLDQRTSDQQVHGIITEVLGNPGDIGVQARLVAEKFSLPFLFSTTAQQEAGTAVPTPGHDHRTDLRDILLYTVDGEDAKDFDDAVAVEKTRNGYRLYVSIADVGAYVKPGSTLDKEAYERGTSVYFPGTVIPMLPENLSNNLCSLLPGTDKLTVTVVIDYNRTGEVQKKQFLRSIIRSHNRFTYDTIKKIIVDKNPAVRRAHKEFVTPLKWAAELANKLIDKRTERGAIGFSIPEADITLDDTGLVRSITRSSRHFAHQIIEEFMLAANEAVAQLFSERNLPTLYRVHEKPDPEKLSNFIDFSKTLGIELPKTTDTPAWYNIIIDNVKGTPHEYIVNNLLLRTMQQARYSTEDKGHFGLALETYCHFTSPIRRYPDLIVHRLLCRVIAEAADKKTNKIKIRPVSSLSEDGIHLSERERTAISSEREMAERLKLEYMSRKIGESFQAVIAGVSESAFFIELLDMFISGIVPLSLLSDDYYILDEKRHRLIGDISGRILQIGNVVEVVLAEIDHSHKKIVFRLKQP